MDLKNKHRRILLNKNQSGSLEYCEACDVVEMEVGFVSIRLHAKDMKIFSQLIQGAEMRLNYYRLEESRYEADVLEIGEIH